MKSPLRLASCTLVVSLCVGGSAYAQGPSKAVTPVAVTAPAKVAKPAPAKAAATGPRISTVARTPVASITARRANPAGPFARLNEVQRDSIIEHSRLLLGIRYKWAGETPERGMDCSGFVRYVFGKLGISLPHSSAILARLGAPIGKDTSEMRAGDLLVFSKRTSKRISHVGIYVGDGMMVHASSRSKAVVETPLLEYRNKMNLRGVRRVFAVDSAAANERLPIPQ